MSVDTVSGVIKNYAWGTPGGIDRVAGWPVSTEVQAEWWFGDHPLGQATVTASGQELSGWLADRGFSHLGFLLKVLAPSTPLSLQVHPTTAQAESGFDDEEARGVPREAPERVFRDRLAKPEVIVAVGGEFDALAGNASDREVGERIARLEAAGYPGELAAAWREKLASGRDVCVAWLLGGSADARDVVAALGPVRHALSLLDLLWGHYPGDAGCAVALMLNRVTLAPGEALFVEAGQPHAYLSGVGVELMAPSDNVVRGGLTPKHVDVDTLLRVGSFDPSPSPFLTPVTHSPSRQEYAPPGVDFGLHRVDTRRSSETVSVPLGTPAIALSIDGEASFEVDGEPVSCTRGQAVVMAESGRSSVSLVVGAGNALWVAYRR